MIGRRDPQVGDVFAIRGRNNLGRVVSAGAVVGPTHGCLLVYVYRDSTLSRDALLVPPMLTTRAPFFRGLFEPRHGRPLLPGETFETHGFRDAAGRLLDELGRPLAAASPGAPVGTYRLLDAGGVMDLLARTDVKA
jgi:hypothetical protein